MEVEDHLRGLRLAVSDHGELTEVATEDDAEGLHIGDVEIARGRRWRYRAQVGSTSARKAPLSAPLDVAGAQLVDERLRVGSGNVGDALRRRALRRFSTAMKLRNREPSEKVPG